MHNHLGNTQSACVKKSVPLVCCDLDPPPSPVDTPFYGGSALHAKLSVAPLNFLDLSKKACIRKGISMK